MNDIETKPDRLKRVVAYMKRNNIINSQKDLCEMLGYNNESTISQFLNGHNPIPKAFVSKFLPYLPGLNEDWVETGNGEMFGPPVIAETVTQEATGENANNQNSSGVSSPNTNVQGNNNHVGACASVENALKEMELHRELVKTAQDQTARAQQQTDKAQEQTTLALNQMRELIDMNKEQFNRFMDLLEKQYSK